MGGRSVATTANYLFRCASLSGIMRYSKQAKPANKH